MNKHFINGVNLTLAIGSIIFGGAIIMKLNDIHEEIKYFERRKDVYLSKEEHDLMLKKQMEELSKEED